jgi:prevent-host-death family protein
MATWALARAKAQLSEVVELAATNGPQQITRDGRPVAVLVSAEEWEQRTPPKRSLGDAFRASPAFGVGIDFKRVNLEARRVDLS